jgi:PAS domain S-box-containing protein
MSDPIISTRPTSRLSSQGVLDALKLIVGGAPLTDVLNSVARLIEAHSDGMLCSVFLMQPDGLHMRYGAAPTLPAAYRTATDGLTIGLTGGSCSRAAYLGQPVFTTDILTDAGWARHRETALRAGLRAAWSSPILSVDGRVVGTFGMFYREPRSPTPAEIRLIDQASRIAGIAIERERSQGALAAAFDELKASQAQLSQVVDSVPYYIVVLDADGSVVYANQTVLKYVGFSVEEMRQGDFRDRVFHPEDQERLRELRQQGFAGRTPWENEVRVRGHDGRYRWFVIQYTPLFDETGRVLRWCAAGRDIHDQRRGEERLRNENIALREEIDRTSMHETIVGASGSLRAVLTQVDRVAPTDSTVLIVGETGTGKELIAAAIHKQSTRAGRAFIRVNCSAIPQALIASELFGHEKGAFTGALARRVGRFEAADGGTILLDEIGELSAETQVSLLRVLQEREVERVGSSRPIAVDVRVLAATNRDLEADVADGTFRRDLFYRLNVFPIRMPSLRERRDDIPLLVEYFVARYAKKAGKKIRRIDRSTMDRLQRYDWPGNIRELQNVVERAVILTDGEEFVVDGAWLESSRPRAAARATAVTGTGSLAEEKRAFAARERQAIEDALAVSNGRVSGPNGAAAKLGIPHQTLQSKMASLGIDARRFRG